MKRSRKVLCLLCLLVSLASSAHGSQIACSELLLRTEGGVTVLLRANPLDLQIIGTDTPILMVPPNRSWLGRLLNSPQAWLHNRAAAEVNAAAQELNRQPTKVYAHRRMARALQTCLLFEGVRTELLTEPSGALKVVYRPSPLQSSKSSNWRTELATFLHQFDVSLTTPTMQIGGTSRFVKLADGRRELELSELPSAPQSGGGPTPLALHELFHFFQDRLRGSSRDAEAWPEHYIRLAVDQKLALPKTIELGTGPFRSWARMDIKKHYRMSQGYSVEEAGAHFFEAQVDLEIANALLAPLNGENLSDKERLGILLKPDLLLAAITALQHLDTSALFSEESAGIYEEMLTILERNPSGLKLEITETGYPGVWVNIPSKHSVFIVSHTPETLLAQFRSNPELLQRELRLGLSKVQSEVAAASSLMPRVRKTLALVFQVIDLMLPEGKVAVELEAGDGPITYKEVYTYLSRDGSS